MEILTVAIQKGGAGKTTTAVAIAQGAVYKGKRTLLIDLDPQGNATLSLNGFELKTSSYNLITKGTATPAKTDCGVDLIGAVWELSNIKTERGSARRLQNALEQFKSKYDLIVIDTPPTMGELQLNALQAATALIIPVEADIYNLQSLYQIVDTARQMQASNPALTIKGFIITKLDARSTLTKQMQEQLIITANKENIAYLGSIRNGVAIKEAAALQKSLFEHAPNSKPAVDYLALIDQIL